MANPDKRQPYLFWIDLEMTGLNAQSDHILEAAVVITDRHLKTISEYQTTVFQPQAVLDEMNEWCQQHHRESGLIDRVADGISIQKLDIILSDMADKYYKGVPVILCGNSIHQDRKFIDQHLPEFSKRLHYRLLDVSSFKVTFQELFDRHLEKQNTHRALDDIYESIKEFKYYLAAIHIKR